MKQTMDRLHTLNHEGMTFRLIDQGPLHGEIIVLLHGFPQRATCWDRVAPLLNNAGYRTIALDQRGFTPGARPQGRRAYKVAHLAADVVALIDRLGATAVHLVGHDWGSFVGWTVAGHYPHRIKTFTSISLPHPRAFAHSLFTSKQLIHSWYMLFFQLPWLPEQMLIHWTNVREKQLRNALMDDELIRRYNKEMIEEGALHGGINWYRALPFFGKAPTVKVPTTHIWGTADNSLERKGAERCGRYVEAPYELVVVEGGSHWLPEQRPEEVAQAILRRVQSTHAQ